MYTHISKWLSLFFTNKGSEPDDHDDDEEVKSKPSTQLTGEIVRVFRSCAHCKLIPCMIPQLKQ